MPCCGCSLSGLTVTAVVLGLLESILGMSWNILVITVIELHKSNSTTNIDEIQVTTIQTPPEVTDLTQDYFFSGNVTDPLSWQLLKNMLTSEKALKQENILEIVITALVLNSLWLITTLGLAIGNAEQCRGMLKPWIGVTVIVTITDIAATIFFIFKIVKDVDNIDIKTPFTNLYVFFAVLCSRGAIIVWMVNIALCVFVAQRVKEIESLKKKSTLFDNDFRIAPFTLHSPYDTFENGNSYVKPPKNFRPHTPPPDYEGLNGKKRRSSFPSEYETVTLPLSLTSSRTSMARRPLSQSSYLYDDSVELQHRTSCAAETVVHHAYENKGLVMESEEWMGIPRPTLLKSSHQ